MFGLSSIPFKKKSITEDVAREKDNFKPLIYAKDWVLSMFSSKKAYKTDFNLFDPQDKRAALEVCQPFAMVMDKCGTLMKNGKLYVTDKNGNEKPAYKDIVDLLKKPNVFQNEKSFLKNIEINLKTFGYCPIYLLRALSKDLPKTMTPIPPELFHLEGTGKAFSQTDIKDIIKRAYITWGNKEIELGKEEYIVIYDSVVSYPAQEGEEITFYTPVNSLSPHTRNYMAQIIGRGNLIVNGGPKGILYGNDTSELGNAALTEKEANDLNSKFKRKFGIVNKLYEIMVTNKKVGWVTIGSNTQQMMLHDEDKACAKDIANTVGLQPDMFSGDAKYDNKEMSERASYQDLIIPDSENIAQTLTEGICPPGAFIKIDFSHVSCLQEDISRMSTALSSASNAIKSLYDSRLITFDEGRMELSKYIDIDPEKPKGEFKDENIPESGETVQEL